MNESRVNMVHLINQGTYGCIYHPGINCKGKKENIRYVTKIQKNEKTIKNELNIGEKVRKIKGYTRLFAPIIKDCNVSISKSYLEEIKKCKPLKIESSADLANEYLITKLRFVGNTNIRDYLLSVDDVLSTHNGSSIGVNKQKKTMEPKKQMKRIKTAHKFLLSSIKKLLKVGIVHYDIKYNNIMFDIKSNNPVMIDFGISLDIDKLKTDPVKDSDQLKQMFYAYDTYPYWCIDICAMNYLFQMDVIEGQISQKEIDEIWNVFVYGFSQENEKNEERISNDIFTTLFFESNKLIENMKIQWIEFMTQFIGKPWKDYYNYIIENRIYETWDIYSIEVVFMFILDEWIRNNPKLLQDSDGTNTIIKNQIEKYKDRFQEIIFCRPDERKSLEIFQ